MDPAIPDVSDWGSGTVADYFTGQGFRSEHAEVFLRQVSPRYAWITLARVGGYLFRYSIGRYSKCILHTFSGIFINLYLKYLRIQKIQPFPVSVSYNRYISKVCNNVTLN